MNVLIHVIVGAALIAAVLVGQSYSDQCLTKIKKTKREDK